MLEAGSVGSSCVTNILFKNFCDTLVSGFMWWSVGYAFAYGSPSSSFIGHSQFFLDTNHISICAYSDWFFQWTFCATTATIVSGAMAGRTQLIAYIVYSIALTGFVYPVVVHWTWSGDAWLSEKGYSDFAGSGIVHACGGTAALVGAIFVGPRGTADFEDYEKKWDIPGHSMPLVALGTLILIFGFFGFNGGSVLALDSQDDAALISLAIVNTVMAATGGGLMAIVLQRAFHKHWSLMMACNGAIAGMVAVCASADKVYPWAGLLIGMVGALSFYGWSTMLHTFGVDDAIDAVGVHLGAGIWGTIAAPLFNFNDSIFYHGTKTAWEMYVLFCMQHLLYRCWPCCPLLSLLWAPFLGASPRKLECHESYATHIANVRSFGFPAHGKQARVEPLRCSRHHGLDRGDDDHPVCRDEGVGCLACVR